MQIEHITLGGNSTIRDSDSIEQRTIEVLNDFKLGIGVSKEIPFPLSKLTVKITSTEEGALFDFKKNGQIGITNVCCFDSEYTHTMFDLVKQFHSMLKFGDPRLPVLDNWIYSIPINPLAFFDDEISLAGEVELYIYYMLYLGRL